MGLLSLVGDVELNQSGRADNMRIVDELLRLAKSHGGKTYAIGRFFLEEAESLYGAEHLQELRAFRQTADPQDRLNPGKAFQ